MGANRREITDEMRIAAIERFGGNCTEAAMELGLNPTTLQRFVRRRSQPFTIADLPDVDLPVEELVKHRKRQFEAKRAYEEAHRLIQVRVNLDGPIGILHFGDPHVDDDGTDIALLESHAKLTRDVDGLWGANVGDSTNNWIGRLAHLYSQQGTTAKQAWMLGEWFVKSARWLYMVGGNHDAWSGAGDPLNWIAKQTGTLYKDSQVRLALNFPNGRSVRINCRHDFAGSSQYNSAHGATKAAMFGVRDHIFVAGHKHESGYNVWKDPAEQFVIHLMKVASYKVYDRYAKEKGFRDLSFGPACVTTVNPRLPESHPDMIKVWWSPEEGADFLRWLRSRKAA